MILAGKIKRYSPYGGGSVCRETLSANTCKRSEVLAEALRPTQGWKHLQNGPQTVSHWRWSAIDRHEVRPHTYITLCQGLDALLWLLLVVENMSSSVCGASFCLLEHYCTTCRQGTSLGVSQSMGPPTFTPSPGLRATPAAAMQTPDTGHLSRSEVARQIRANFDNLVRASPLPRVSTHAPIPFCTGVTAPRSTTCLSPLRRFCTAVL